MRSRAVAALDDNQPLWSHYFSGPQLLTVRADGDAPLCKVRKEPFAGLAAARSRHGPIFANKKESRPGLDGDHPFLVISPPVPYVMIAPVGGNPLCYQQV